MYQFTQERTVSESDLWLSRDIERRTARDIFLTPSEGYDQGDDEINDRFTSSGNYLNDKKQKS